MYRVRRILQSILIFDVEHKRWKQNLWHLYEKVEAYRKHVKSIKNMKSGLQFRKSKPWTPTFSISRHKNRYHQAVQNQINIENNSLVKRIGIIQTNNELKTFNEIPYEIPSNKENFITVQSRKRQREKKQIEKENHKLFQRIMSANKSYDSRVLEMSWSMNVRYRQNIRNKQFVPDYLKLAKSRQKSLEKVRSSTKSRVVNTTDSPRPPRKLKRQRNSVILIR